VLPAPIDGLAPEAPATAGLTLLPHAPRSQPVGMPAAGGAGGQSRSVNPDGSARKARVRWNETQLELLLDFVEDHFKDHLKALEEWKAGDGDKPSFPWADAKHDPYNLSADTGGCSIKGTGIRDKWRLIAKAWQDCGEVVGDATDPLYRHMLRNVQLETRVRRVMTKGAWALSASHAELDKALEEGLGAAPKKAAGKGAGSSKGAGVGSSRGKGAGPSKGTKPKATKPKATKPKATKPKAEEPQESAETEFAEESDESPPRGKRRSARLSQESPQAKRRKTARPVRGQR